MKKNCCFVSLVLVFVVIFTATGVSLAESLQTDGNIVGIWMGTLKIPSMELRVVFRIAKTEDGLLKAFADIPDQQVFDIPVDEVIFENSNIRLEIKSEGGVYEGKLVDNVTIEGFLKQDGGSMPLTLKKVDKVPERDNGINVLLDHAHQFTFYMAWDIPPLLREGEFRVIGSQATIDTVLASDKSSLVRFGHGEQRPFGWLPNPRFNTVITYQLDTNSQTYLPKEIESLRRFVEAGGGLIIIGGGLHSSNEIGKWSLNSLCREFGASFTDQQSKAPFTILDDPIVSSLETSESGAFHSIAIDDSWKVLVHGNDSSPVLAIREFRKGRVAVISDIEIIKWGKDSIKNTAESKVANGSFLHSLLNWVSANQPPVSGSRNLPSEASGGGAIYPELEADIGNITILYAKNQKESLLDAVRQYMPQVKEKIESWLPSKPIEDRMYLILSSGDGGGWAVNIYEPKEVGIISLDQEGILSIFAHELAHTMSGPPNDNGQIAGRLPELFSEAHAGWFQGKIVELRTGSRAEHEPNKLFDIDKDGKSIDIAKIHGDDSWNGWTKLWWIFQKFDERYGTVWYPRWLWVKNMRWKDSPDRQLNWDDVVEDMSIAVGEDLFPFFQEIGTTLEKNSLPEIEFLGDKIILSVAPITITRTGKAILEEIGDYKKEIITTKH